jgi:hypothetical protein
MLTCLAAAAACWAYGAVDQLSLRYERPLPELEAFESQEPSSFWERFEQAFDERADKTFADRLHPLNVMGWSFNRQDDKWQDVVERGNRSMRSGLVKSVQYSLRDASIALPVANWLEAREDSLNELFLNSVDAVEEEAVSPLDPMYRPAERRWWQDLAEKRVLRYGIRPVRTDPYTFLSLRLQEANRLLLLGHVRYYFRNFGDHRFELALSLPVAYGFTLDVGNAYQFGQHEDEQKMVLKLFKPLKRGGVVHVGVELQHSPAMFAGISLPL